MLNIYTAGAQFNDTAGNANTIIKQQNFNPAANESKQLVQIRNVDQTKVEKLRKDDAFWYVNTTPVREEAKQPTEPFSNKLARKQWFRNLMWSLIIGSFIAVLVWFLVSSNVKLFRKKAVIVDKSKNDDVTSENIFSINYDEEMHKAVSTANYRSAIRLMYLQLLKNLSERQIIHYKQEKTNNDYVMQLYNTRYYKTFFQLTRNFEYTWYGQFQIKQEAFKIIESEFASFKQTLP